jgi:voltage-gated potassium channel
MARDVTRPVNRFVMRRLQRAFETGRILPFLMVTIAALTVAFGFVMWLVDRNDFPTLGLALWWAAQTVTTVGYGDASPVEPAGRLLASGLMVFGYASLSLLTGIVASMLVYRRTADTGLEAALARIENRLAEVERLVREQQAAD